MFSPRSKFLPMPTPHRILYAQSPVPQNRTGPPVSPGAPCPTHTLSPSRAPPCAQPFAHPVVPSGWVLPASLRTPSSAPTARHTRISRRSAPHFRFRVLGITSASGSAAPHVGPGGAERSGVGSRDGGV